MYYGLRERDSGGLLHYLQLSLWNMEKRQNVAIPFFPQVENKELGKMKIGECRLFRWKATNKRLDVLNYIGLLLLRFL